MSRKTAIEILSRLKEKLVSECDAVRLVDVLRCNTELTDYKRLSRCLEPDEIAVSIILYALRRCNRSWKTDIRYLSETRQSDAFAKTEVLQKVRYWLVVKREKDSQEKLYRLYCKLRRKDKILLCSAVEKQTGVTWEGVARLLTPNDCVQITNSRVWMGDITCFCGNTSAGVARSQQTSLCMADVTSTSDIFDNEKDLGSAKVTAEALSILEFEIEDDLPTVQKEEIQLLSGANPETDTSDHELDTIPTILPQTITSVDTEADNSSACPNSASTTQQTPSVQTNAALCLICQMDKKKERKELRDLTNASRIGLVERLPIFRDLKQSHGFVFKDYELEERLLSVDTLQFLSSRQFKIHKNCYSRYNKDVLRKTEAKRRKVDISDESEPGSSASTSRVSTRASSGSVALPFGAMLCLICEKGDMYDPKTPITSSMKLRAAGSKVESSSHAKAFTDKLRTEASRLEDNKLLAKLHTDVRAAEMYYHAPCLTKYHDRYSRAVKAEDSEDSDDSESTLLTPGKEFELFAALEALRVFIQDSINNKFTLKDLRAVWSSRCEEICDLPVSTHATRFAKLLKKHQDLLGISVWQDREYADYQIIRKSTLRIALKSSEYCVQLRNVVDSIREELLSLPLPSEMADLVTSEEIPMKKLRMLITMICDRSPMFERIDDPLETVCQLIRMHTRVFCRPSREAQREAVKQLPDKLFQRRIPRFREVPVIRHLTLKVYSTVRSKDLISTLHKNGLTLSYDRVLSFTDELSSIMIELYKRSGNRVLPSKIKSDIFTMFADDNIDLNSKSVTATKNYHGSSISVLQFPTIANPGLRRDKKMLADLSESERKTSNCESLASFLSVDESVRIRKGDVHSPIQLVNYDEALDQTLNDVYGAHLAEEVNWLSLVSERSMQVRGVLDGECGLSWTAYHSKKQQDIDTQEPLSIVSMLPVIDHVVHDIPFQNHALCTAMDYTKHLNPGQTTVVCSDQPLYALKKIILWANPAKFQKNDTCRIINLDPETRISSPTIDVSYCCYNSDVFSFFGVMHIEQVVLKCTGDLIMGTGLEDVLGSAGLKTVGLMTSLCNVSMLKKARYAGQVLGPVLQSLLVAAYRQITGAKDDAGLKAWAEKQEEPMLKYLLGIRDHIMNVNLLVKSHRESNFELFIATLEKLCPIVFALDHTHYSRWLPVFVHELKLLKITDPALFEKFQEGYFIVKESKTKFSSIACDQAHAQTYKLIKSKSGFADVLNKEESAVLRKLENIIPEVHGYLENIDRDNTLMWLMRNPIFSTYLVDFLQCRVL